MPTKSYIIKQVENALEIFTENDKKKGMEMLKDIINNNKSSDKKKRYPSGYNLFVRKKLVEMAEADSVPKTERMALASKEWKGLTEQDKMPFCIQAKELKDSTSDDESSKKSNDIDIDSIIDTIHPSHSESETRENDENNENNENRENDEIEESEEESPTIQKKKQTSNKSDKTAKIEKKRIQEDNTSPLKAKNNKKTNQDKKVNVKKEKA
jgi:hypothetical protein